MKYIAVADTDIGIQKKTNQDSLIIKHANSPCGEIVMAIICDGMGGLSKGELASATVIRAFSEWFDNDLPGFLENFNAKKVEEKWNQMLKKINSEILSYSEKCGVSIGTTFSGILLVDDVYIFSHIGDSRIYYLMGSEIFQLTDDHTFVAREIANGNMTVEEAKTDKRRNLLLQCVGASRKVEPQSEIGEVRAGAYMLCSDGFRHEISPEEMFLELNPDCLTDKNDMKRKIRRLIDKNKERNEKDNISVILIKAY